MQLLIVESPNKIKKIQGFLGNDWLVGASAGHICDIPGGSLGVNRGDGSYQITYALDPKKEDLVKGLREKVARVGAQNVWLATDPDREGEAISYHLCRTLGLDTGTTKRVTFQEITGPAIQAALARPRRLDMQLVHAQEARRAIDRLVGFEVSPSLIDSQPRPAPGVPHFSAGRVQSVAARLVVELEETILGFAAGSGLSFPLSARFRTPADEQLPARYVGEAPGSEADARAQVSRLATVTDWRVLAVTQSPVETLPPPSYSTSTLQQDGVRKLKLSVGQVADLAQKLFEAGHITYIRTDSVNIGEEGTQQALSQISSQYGAPYACRRTFKEKPGVQGGHEAIRPTHWDVTTAGDTPQEQALYKLIYTRTLASQMAPARYAQTIISVGTGAGEAGPRFESRVRVLEFPGYRAAYQEAEEESLAGDEESAEGAEGATLRVPLQSGQALELSRVQAAGRVQKPPRRYDEATLVGELEKRQIGRPSTYASIIKTIFQKQYVALATVGGKKVATKTFSWETGPGGGTSQEKSRTETVGGDKNKLVPTERGRVAAAFLKRYFGELVDYGFTASCEQQLDVIAEGQGTYEQLLRDFDGRLLEQKKMADAANPPRPRASKRLVGEFRGQPVYAVTTQYGPAVRWAPEPDPAKEKSYKLGENLAAETVTLEQAVAAIEHGLVHKLRYVGDYDKEIIEGGVSEKTGRPYLRWKGNFYNMPPDVTDLALLTPDAARLAIAGQLQARAEALVKQIDKNWSVVRRDDGKGLQLRHSNGDNCRLKTGTTEEEVKEWTSSQAAKTMRSFKEWQAKQPARA